MKCKNKSTQCNSWSHPSTNPRAHKYWLRATPTGYFMVSKRTTQAQLLIYSTSLFWLCSFATVHIIRSPRRIQYLRVNALGKRQPLLTQMAKAPAPIFPAVSGRSDEDGIKQTTTRDSHTLQTLQLESSALHLVLVLRSKGIQQSPSSFPRK